MECLHLPKTLPSQDPLQNQKFKKHDLFIFPKKNRVLSIGGVETGSIAMTQNVKIKLFDEFLLEYHL